jgi:Family of unknown function (DUF6476)
MVQHPPDRQPDRQDDEFPEPSHLRRLRWLVTGLTVVLIVGVLAIAATIVIRLGFGVGEAFSGGPVRAERFALPAGAEIVAVGRGAGSVIFVLRAPDGAEALHVFDAASGEPESRSAITRETGGN